MKVTSDILKLSLFQYWRFNRGFIVAEEFSIGDNISDIFAFNEEYSLEVEVKVSKNDLLKLEGKKSKHRSHKLNNLDHHYPTNKFYLCVPSKLKEVAIEWVLDNNSKFGLFIFDEERFQKCFKNDIFCHSTYDITDFLSIEKKGLLLHNYNFNYNRICHNIMLRLSNNNCSLMNKMFENKLGNKYYLNDLEYNI